MGTKNPKLARYRKRKSKRKAATFFVYVLIADADYEEDGYRLLGVYRTKKAAETSFERYLASTGYGGSNEFTSQTNMKITRTPLRRSAQNH